MKLFKNVTEQVRSYLSENQYCHEVIQSNERCFKKLGAYLEGKGIDYSPETAREWLAAFYDSFSSTDKRCYRMAVLRLRDIYEHGEILPEHDTRHLMSYTILSDNLKKSLDSYLESLKGRLSESTIGNHMHPCSRFLIYVQRVGIHAINDITFETIYHFYQSDVHRGHYKKSHMNAALSSMMGYFWSEGIVPYGFTIMIHYLSHGKRNSGCYWNEVPASAHEEIATAMESFPVVDTDRLRDYRDYSIRLHQENGYSKAVTTVLRRTIDLLILFLEMNGYKYNPEIATIWFDSVCSCFGKEKYSIYRSLCIVAEYHTSSCINLLAVHRMKPKAFDLLPEWSREAAVKYVESKEKEGWARSTMDMIRSCICRFCNYLDLAGIRSFMELTAAHIKQFNADDIHKTPYGKNAYNTRIRKFLMYLGEYRYISNPMLFIALTCTSAPRESIIVVLNEGEMAGLKEQLGSDDGRLSLRKKAMLLLGLKMGLRASDVVNLTIDDVNWGRASIRFVQQKTEVEVEIPMPPEVGNALFRYITEERHKKSVKEIFLSEKAPHKPVKRATCNNALKDALPDRNVNGSGFHVMRKTFATQLLRNGVGMPLVAEALGQRGTSAVNRYLSLDTDRMRMCPLDLADCGIGGWKHG
ncbi:MAG: tyrosine-type recombinase/integrase [Lachnospiraceae bacterium]|nr:tyrosine-type recombinase/integrase [Lachnospiraceae bacterium]